ncbi:MAG: NAD(P)/FAD-dependent oxidoreductase [Fimbriimonas sp.]|nr:NAD(P)/FAD-dependent oxidoreductase [Fimbriimonas sp.]
MNCDVAIIGGGPAGATVGTLLKKYNPDLDVVILEKERFPRDHVGESLLPAVTGVLDEMGVWDKVEAANFPIKLGATYRWGKQSDQDLYYFHFLPEGKFSQTERPGKYIGQRRQTTFQVDRSVYDKILLDHAAECGCRVFEEARVSQIVRSGDRIESLDVSFAGKQDTVEARYYVDASGGESLARKAFGVEVMSPTLLRNIAIWDYWQNTEWAEKIGVDGTYVYVMSIGYGWIWFIPLGPTRTSIGFITSAEYYKNSGQSTEQMYLEAIQREPLIQSLTANAMRENRLEATKDWSFVADRLTGENWFLAGDACGFADPILAAGLTLAQMGSRRVAYSILEIERGEVDTAWIKFQFNRTQRRNTLNHIRFADYWYSANEQFTDLKEYCTEIARGAGLTLDADAAFQWLGTGGFADELNGLPFSGTYTLTAIKAFTSRFGSKDTSWFVYENNLFELNTEGSERDSIALYDQGRVRQLECLRRGEQVWPLNGVYRCIYRAFQSREREIQLLAERFIYELQRDGIPLSSDMARICLETLEALVTEGWVKASYDPSIPLLDVGKY